MSDNPYALIKGNKIIRKSFLDFPEREIGEIREDEKTSLQYFEDRFRIASRKVDDLEKEITENENKGSYLMKLIHLKDYLVMFDGLGDFGGLFERLQKQELYLKEIIRLNRLKNLEIKRSLLSELEVLKDHYNLNEAGERIKEIKQSWIRTGAVAEEFQEEFEEKFSELLDLFNKRKQIFYEDRKKMMHENVTKYQDILTRSEKLLNSPDIVNSAEQLKSIQVEWKALGKIPAEDYNRLKDQFQKINDEVFNRFKDYKKQLKKDKQSAIHDTLAQKKDIISELKQAIQKENINLEVTRKEFIQKWKKINNIFHKEIYQVNNQFGSEIARIEELLFLDKIVRKKNSKFDKLPEKRKKELKVNTLKELIRRDQRDLEQYNRNLEIFNLKSGTIDRMINGKMQAKENSLDIKKDLLNKLES